MLQHGGGASSPPLRASYGRLRILHYSLPRGGRVDSFSAIVRRLTCAVFFVVLGLHAVPSTAAQYPDLASAMSACNAVIASIGSPSTWRCRDGSSSAVAYETVGYVVYEETYNANYPRWQGVASFSYTPGAPANPCSGMQSANISQDGRVLNGSQMCVRGPVQPNGSQAMCGMGLSPVSPPTYNPNRGVWETIVTVTPTAAICTYGGAQDGGILSPTGQASPIAGPPVTDPLPPPVTTPPKICGGASCYDPATNTACAVAGGAQVCVPVNGGCASSGGASVCNGTPNPPLPPAAAVPDPATMIQGTQQVTQANPTTGAVTTSTTVVYAGPSTPVTSGAKPTDSTPAPASTSPTADKTGFGGGTDCNTPPMCSGDAALCGIARTQWATTCELHTDLVGPTGKAPTTGAAPPTQSQLWVTPTKGTTVGDLANAGTYDQTGAGSATQCPLSDFHFSTVVGLKVPFSDGCDPLSWLGTVGVGFALYRAARITAGSNV